MGKYKIPSWAEDKADTLIERIIDETWTYDDVAMFLVEIEGQGVKKAIDVCVEYTTEENYNSVRFLASNILRSIEYLMPKEDSEDNQERHVDTEPKSV